MLFAGLHGFSKIRHISVLILHFAVDALTYQNPDLCLWKKICKIFVHDKFFHLLVLLICDLSCLRSFSAVVPCGRSLPPAVSRCTTRRAESRLNKKRRIPHLQWPNDTKSGAAFFQRPHPAARSFLIM